MSWKALVAILSVVGVLIGGILSLRSTARTGMPSGEALERAKKRALENQAEEAAEDKRRRQ